MSNPYSTGPVSISAAISAIAGDSSSDTSTVTNTAGTVLFTSADKTSLDGIVGGGQIGYNWQMQRAVFGLEADIQGTDEKARAPSPAR